MQAPRALLWCAAAIVLAAVGCSKPAAPPAAPLESAKFHMDHGKWDEAIADATQAMRTHPNEHRAFTLRGRAYHAKGDFERAAADLSEAIRIAPKHPEAYYSRALVYRRLGKQREMMADELKGREVDPSYAKDFIREPEQIQRQRVADTTMQALKDSGKKPEEPEPEPIAKKHARSRTQPKPEMPKLDPLTGLAEEAPEGQREVAKDAFGLPIELGANQAPDDLFGRGPDAQRTPDDGASHAQDDRNATADADPGQAGGVRPKLPPRGAGRGDPGDRYGKPAAPRRTFANEGVDPESEFEDEEFEGEGEAAPQPQLPPRGQRQGNPYAGGARTPFSGGRTSLRPGDSESPEPILDTQEVAPKIGGRPAAAGSRARARAGARAASPTGRQPTPYSQRAQTPFNRSEGTPFSRPNGGGQLPQIEEEFD